MAKELVISAAPHETRVAILEDGLLCEIYIEREKEFALVGSIYKGRVTRVLPGMQSAFVDIGLDSDAFLYVGDFLENLEDYDHVVTAVEGKVEKMEQQGGAVFAPSGEGGAQPASADAGGPPVSLPGETRAAAAGGQAPGTAPLHDLPPEEAGDQIGNVAEPPLSQRHSTPSGGPSGYAAPERGGGYGRDRGARSDRGGDRGADRGGRRGRGRWRGGRDRGGDRRPGRDLPPSKYASSSSRPFAPRPSNVPHEPAGDEPPAGYPPVILPGESLAKYKGRPPEAPQASHEAAPHAGESSAAAGLPPSLYATPGEPSVSGPVEPSSADIAAAAESHRDFSREEGSHEEHEHALKHEHEEHEHEDDAHAAHAGGSHDLSDDEVSALAEQLAEARQEEATAEAAETAPSLLDDEDAVAPEGAAEADDFAAEVEEQEHEDAIAGDAEVDAETLEGDLAEKEADTEVEALAPGTEETVVPPEIGETAPLLRPSDP